MNGQSQLQYENLQLQGISLTSATSTTTTYSGPRLVTGFSSSDVVSSLSSGVSGGSLPPSIPAAASSLMAANTPSSSVPSSIPGYTGPTIPDLRTDGHANSLASQVFSIILREIPALAAAPSSQQSSGPPASVPPPVHSQALRGSAPFPAPPPPPHYPPSAGLYSGAGAHQQRAPAVHPQLHHLLPGGLLPPTPQDSAQVEIAAVRQRLDALQARQASQEVSGWYQDPAQDLQVQSSGSSNISLDWLFTAHIKNPQYKAIDFARLGKFSYLNQIKDSN